MKTKILAILIATGLFVLACGCIEENKESESGQTQGAMYFTEIKIGDKPTDDFSHINVTFSEVKLYSNETNWISITLETKIFDLIYLHMNNLNDTLGVGNLQEGNYTKLWIVVENVTGVLNSTGEEVEIDVPSNTLKIQHLFNLTGGNNTIIVEIDLDNSVKVIGQGKAYKITPVISSLSVHHENGVMEQERDRERLREMTENRPPTIDLVTNDSRGKPIQVEVNEEITFNASETFDIEGDSITYTWDFGDDKTATGAVVAHSYPDRGSYWVTLTASDGTDTSESQVHVTVNGKGNGTP